MSESRYKLCRQVVIELEFCICVLFWSLYQRTGHYVTFPRIYNLLTIQMAKHCHSWRRRPCWNCVRHYWTFFFKGPMAVHSKASSVDSVPQSFLVHFIVSGLHNSLCIIEGGWELSSLPLFALFHECWLSAMRLHKEQDKPSHTLSGTVFVHCNHLSIFQGS